MDASFSLRSKKDLIERFVASLNVESDVDESWKSFIEEQKAMELEQIIEDENLDVPATHLFVSQAFRIVSRESRSRNFKRLKSSKSPKGRLFKMLGSEVLISWIRDLAVLEMYLAVRSWTKELPNISRKRQAL